MKKQKTTKSTKNINDVKLEILADTLISENIITKRAV